MKNKLIYFLPLICWFFIINYLLFFFKSSGEGGNIPNADKFIHAILFMILTILGVFAGIKYYNQKKKLNSYLRTYILLGILFAAITELIQAFIIPARTGDYADFIADSIGILIGYYLFTKTLSKMPIKLKKLFLKL